MNAVTWLVVCAGVSILLQDRLFVLLTVAFVLWCAIPQVAAHWLVGPPIGGITLHPAALLILAVAVVQLVKHASSVVDVVLRRPAMAGILFSVATVSVGLGMLAKGSGLTAFSTAIEQVVAPTAFFFLAGLCMAQNSARARSFRLLVLTVASIEACFAAIQALASSPIIFIADFETEYWYTSTFDRWMGTLDHPLLLGVLLAVATPLLSQLRNTWVVVALLSLFLAGEVLTQSRLGLGLALIGAVQVVWSRRSYATQALVSALLVTGAVLAVRSGFLANLGERLANDTGSAAARSEAWTYFVTHLSDFAWMGSGLGSSYSVSAGAGLGTSFENSFIMYVVDLGLVPALMYFAFMASCCIQSLRVKPNDGITLACTIALVAPLGFSGIASRSAASCIVFTVFAIVAFGPRRSGGRPAGPRSGHVDKEVERKPA